MSALPISSISVQFFRSPKLSSLYSAISSVLFVAFSMTFTTATTASSQTGLLVGKVTDVSNGENLIGATVLLVNTKIGARTDAQGRYTVKNIPVGTYDVKVSYVGYTPKTFTGIVINGGKNTILNAVVTPTKTVGKEVIVEARRTNESQAAVLSQRKNSAQVSDGISSEEIKRLPDSDAGAALKRVTGVQVVGDKYVYVRGVGDRYNNTTLNGLSLTSTEPDKKAFAFDMFPSDLLESANIAKTFTPDLPGNFAGGLVQLNTVEFPSAFSVKVSMSSSYNDNVTFRNGMYVSSVSGSTDWLGIDDGTRSTLPNGMPANRREMSDLLSKVRAEFQTGQGTEATERWQNLTQQFNTKNMQREVSTVSLPNGSLSFAYSNLLLEGDLGVIASLNYSNSYGINNISRNGILGDRSLWFQNSGINSSRSVSWGGLVNLAYKLSQGSTITLKNVYNRSMDEDVVALNGYDNVQFFDLKQISYQFVQKELFSSIIGGEHSFENLGNTVIDWKAGYSRSIRDEPDFRRFRFARQAGSTDPYLSDIPNFAALGQGDGTRAGRFFSSLNDNAYNGALNITIPLDATVKLKVGGLIEDRSRSFSARSFTYVPGPNNQLDFLAFTLRDTNVYVDPSLMFRNENLGVNGFGLSEDSRLADAYTATENLYAGYIMADFPFTIEELPIRAIIGARYENNSQKLSSFNLSDQAVNVNLNTSDVLPALSLMAKITSSSNIRASASQTLARPSLREFAPFTFYDFATQSQVQGNPNLKRSLIQNFDLRWEYFPDIGEVVAVSMFYKNFKNAIEETIFLEQSNVARTFQNTSDSSNARNYGVEFEFRKNCGFLGDAFQNLTFNANYTRVFSNIEVNQGGQIDKRSMWGQAPYSANIGLYYSEPSMGSTFNIGYNRTGKRIILVGLRGAYSFEDPHTYEMPRDVIDFSYVQRLGELFEAKIVVRDLLNQRLVWEQGEQEVASNLRGRTITLGLSLRIR